MRDSQNQGIGSYINTEDEFELIRRSKDRDKFSFAELVDRHQHWVYAIAISYLRNQADAEDIVQETFLRVWTHLTELRDATKFRSWLAKIVTHQAINLLRDNRRIMGTASELTQYDRQYAEHLARIAKSVKINEEMHQLLQVHIQNLPEKYRTVLHLRYISHCSIDEIHKITKESKRTIINQIHVAKRILQKEIKKVD